ncbi:Listeria repeat-containing protein [Histomonas meleagridis]|uniref:Listeria repeat-containing protein n=1 Tax=Histomonas meleagridis TaxID=135588 RepID=UPI00355A0805|nr:Listeria repeat-containing protein [Histomonas meleagridis]KAH0804120.1 Listeria repeat-containing protein [Histomonas meleagridis]
MQENLTDELINNDDALKILEDKNKCNPKEKLPLIIGASVGAVAVILIIVVSVVLTRNNSVDDNQINNTLTPSFTSSIPTSVPQPTNPPDIHYITFDPNTAVGRQFKLAYSLGQVISDLPNNFTKDGYDFDGWCNTPDCSTMVKFPYIFEDDKTFYAKWNKSIKTITISFHPLGAVGIMNEQHYTTETLVQSIPNGFRRTLYAFTGWYYDYEWKKPVKFPTKFDKDYTLYPKWEKLSRFAGVITFEGNGANGTMDPLECSFTQPVLEILNTFNPPSSDQYFDGFYETAFVKMLSVEEHQKVVFPYTFTRNVTFKPIWKNYIYHYITFYFNDEKTPNMNEKYLDGTKIYNLQQPQRENYVFAGWFTSIDLRNESQISLPFIIIKNISVYAKWIKYKVDGMIKFDPNGGFGSMPAKSFSSGAIIDDFVSAFHNTGYTFNGWYISPECTPETRFKFPFSFSQSLTFYAGWKLNIPKGQCLIVYDLNGGEGKIEGQIGTIGSANKVLLERPPKLTTSDNKAFIGWSTNKEQYQFLYSYYQPFTLDEYKVKDQIIHMYAQWSTNYYTVTFDLQGGSGNISPFYVDKTYHHKNDAFIPNFTIIKTNAKLTGWGKSPSGSAEYELGHRIPSNTLNTDLKLYAHYLENGRNNDGKSEKYKGKTVWMSGMNELKEHRWVGIKHFEHQLTCPWQQGDKWWDVKKAQPRGKDSHMSGHAHASNAIHHFLANNEENIKKYYQLYPNITNKTNSTFDGAEHSA